MRIALILLCKQIQLWVLGGSFVNPKECHVRAQGHEITRTAQIYRLSMCNLRQDVPTWQFVVTPATLELLTQ